jgi:hypothetical protein
MVVRARPRRVRVPVLVLGAEHDGFFTDGDIHRTAAAYRTQAEIYPGMGHNLMLDQGWEKVADRIDAWVRELGKSEPHNTDREQMAAEPQTGLEMRTNARPARRAGQSSALCSRQRGRLLSAFLTCRVTAGGMTKRMAVRLPSSSVMIPGWNWWRWV